jgi:heat shock protein 4
VDEVDFNGALKTDKFEEICGTLLDGLKGPIDRCLAEAGLTPAQLDSVELIGGGTRVACVKRRLASILGLDASLVNTGLHTTMNADEAVARGCALQSAILSPRFKVLPYEIVERQIHGVTVSWEGEAEADDAEEEDEKGAGEAAGADAAASSVVMFERGSNFPLVRRVTVRKSGPFTIKASYGDVSAAGSRLDASTPPEIATFTITAPDAATPNKIRVNVKQDVSGIVTLSSAQSMEEVKEEEGKEPEAKEGEEGKEGEEKPAPKKK